MTAIVYAFFPGTKGSDARRDIESWEMFHWPAVVVQAFLPQAWQHGMVSVPARLIRQQLGSALEVVEAAKLTEETETAGDDAGALMWQRRECVLQVEAHEHLTGSETLIRTQS